MSIIRFARLNIPVDIKLIQQEVAAIQKNLWQPHLNRYHYDGEWNVLSLRSPGGTMNALADAVDNLEFADTPLMQACPGIEQLVNGLACEKLAVRLLSLHSGAIIREHTDKELSFENGEARLHFPVFTNPGVEFILDQTAIQMQEGEAWYINANLPHRLANHGTETRIHLVIDCKVNTWLRDLFEFHCIKKEILSEEMNLLRNRDTILSTIRELRIQGSVFSNDLADKLVQQLHHAEQSFTNNN